MILRGAAAIRLYPMTNFRRRRKTPFWVLMQTQTDLALELPKLVSD